MLVRVSSGKDGIVEYLEEGIKSGRELSRDELDHRVCIDGSLSVTDKVINQLNVLDKKENYLHITLSFGEREINENDIISAYDEYKKTLMSAYSDDEFNVYAEIHFPKIKSYTNKETGETVERFPHVHMVIPQTNLITNKSLKPFGLYQSSIPYFEALQESVNRKMNLESPYDNQRKYRLFKDNAEFISRYKGDTFKGNRGEFKSALFESIDAKNIRTMAEFEKELRQYGQIEKSNVGRDDEYLKIKPTGENKFIRLKDTCFKSAYIEDRLLLRAKPTDKQINKLVDEWCDTRSHEMKHIHVASPKVRKAYHALPKSEQKEFLNERRRVYNSKYDLNPRRRTSNRKPSTERIGIKGFTEIGNGLPGLPQRGLVRANGKRAETAESVLSSNANDDLDTARTSRDHQLRRITDRRGRDRLNRGGFDRGGQLRGSVYSAGINVGLPTSAVQLHESAPNSLGFKPRTFSEQLLQAHAKEDVMQKELAYFRVVRKTLEPERILRHFERSHGLVRDNYTTFKAKDGSARIKIGSRAFNVSDFCTQHMHQDWTTTKQLLTTAYQEQQTEKDERRTVNSITFAAGYVTQRYQSKDKRLRLDESIRILRYLQRQEQYGDKKMALADLEKNRVTELLDKNTIENGNLSLSEAAENFKRQQKLAQEVTLRMNDLVAAKNMKKNVVTFTDKNTGDKVFKDFGEKIVMDSRKPSDDHVAVAMTLAAEKFGVVKINGTKAFKQQVIDVAISKDLNIVFASKQMQSQFLQQKEEHQENLKLAKMQTQDKASVVTDNVQKDATNENEIVSAKVKIVEVTPEKLVDDVDKSHVSLAAQMNNTQVVEQSTEQATKLVAHGDAPYLNDEANAKSYYVTLDDGKTHWGVGLKSALKESKANIGDDITVVEKGREPVVVKVPVKNEEGKVIEFKEKEVERIAWDIQVTSPAQRVDVEQVEKTVDTRFDVSYVWNEGQNIDITINGKPPREVSKETLSAIIKDDKFLANYSVEEVLSGKLDLTKSNGIQAVSKQYDEQGKQVVEVNKTTSSIKLK